MPAVGSTNYPGTALEFFNTSATPAQIITVRDALDANTICTIENKQTGRVWSDATSWVGAVSSVGGQDDFGATGLKTDKADESTPGAGVTVDDMLIKDGGAQLDASTTNINDNADPTKQLAFDVSAVSPATERTVYMPDEPVVLSAYAQWVLPVFGLWQADADGAETNGGGMTGGEVTLTEAGAAYAQCYDATNAEFNQLSITAAGTDYTANYQIFSDTHADGDYVAFGADVPFPEFAVDMVGTVAVYGAAALTPEYSQGGAAWATLTVALDNTGTTATDGTTFGEQSGAVTFVPPADWAPETLNGQLAYWVRFRVTTTANVTTEGITNSEQHQLVTPTDGLLAPQAGRITSLGLIDGATTLHTAADVKFLFMNFTKGTHVGELTFPQDKRKDRWTGITLDCAKGDLLGVVCTQEDGTNEVTNAMLLAGVTKNAV
jgi:hypothetical protein